MRKVEKHPVDVFFEFCAMRVKNLPQKLQSVVEMQVQQILFNAENPSAQQPIMSLPHDIVPPPVQAVSFQAPNQYVNPSNNGAAEVFQEDTHGTPYVFSEAMNTVNRY